MKNKLTSVASLALVGLGLLALTGCDLDRPNYSSDGARFGAAAHSGWNSAKRGASTGISNFGEFSRGVANGWGR